MKEGGLDTLRTALMTTGVTTARELGLLDPDGHGTQTHPDASRMIHHDGKAIRQMFNGAQGDTRDVRTVDPETGEVVVEQRAVRTDPDAKVHITGDDRQIHGCKFWHAEVRGPDPYSRVFLGVDHVPEIKNERNSEADIAVRNLLELSPLVPGATGTMADTVLRGTHIDTLERATGWIVMNPVAAKRVNKKTQERTEKENYIRTVTFERADGQKLEVEIWSVGGRLARLDYTDDGTEVLVPLTRASNISRRNPGGDYRTYVEYEVPHPEGRKRIKIREATFNRADDTFNRAENVRQIPPGDPDFDRLIGRRSDAEAANRVVDDHLYLRRAMSIGARGQLFDLVCHAFMQNSVARLRHGGPEPPGAELAA